jgi:LytS/YehU family sensor histidine kinase
MIISISISIVLLLVLSTAGLMGTLFKVYPGLRVTVESVMIKIGGLLFGPIIGLFIGAVTDILDVLLTAGMFHYGYFIAAIAYGFISGLIRSVINASKNSDAKFVIYISLFIFAVGFLVIGDM